MCLCKEMLKMKVIVVLALFIAEGTISSNNSPFNNFIFSNVFYALYLANGYASTSIYGYVCSQPIVPGPCRGIHIRLV